MNSNVMGNLEGATARMADDKRLKEDTITLDDIEEKAESGEISHDEIEKLEQMIGEMRQGQFFESLTMEFSGKLKEIAREMIEFRKDIQEKIEPVMVGLAEYAMPEASNQLEGINETLEKSTMKILDINEEQVELINHQLDSLKSILSGNGDGKNRDEIFKLIEQQVEILNRLSALSMRMMEPLSFQDLVGQRIQKLVKMIKLTETRIGDLIISFGIRLQKYREDPNRTFDDLTQEVENFKSELAGPKNENEGLDQAGIDELLSGL